MRPSRLVDRRIARQGYVLIAVLWLIVLLSAVAFEISRRSRLERLAALNIVDGIVLTAALDASVERARAQLSALSADQQLESMNRVSSPDAFRSQLDPWRDIESLRTDTVRFAMAKFVTSVTDVAAKLNVNFADSESIGLLLSALGVDEAQSRELAASIIIEREEKRERGSATPNRSERGISARPFWSPSNHAFRTVDDVGDAIAMPRELWRRVAPLLTVFGSGRVNPRTAPPAVLLTLPGFSAEVIDAIREIQETKGRLASLEDVLPRLSFSARKVLTTVRPALEQRLTFETTEVEIYSRAWTEGGLFGASIASVSRTDRQLSPQVMRLQ